MEFAIVAPLFFLMVLGMVEFGRLVMVQQILTNGSREGARIAVLDGTSTAEVLTTVERYLTSAAIEGADVTVSPNPPNSAGFGEPVAVTVRVAFDQVSWLPSPMFLSGRTLSASTVMRRETVQ